MKLIALGLILSGVLTLQSAAQSLLKNDKIPEDLLITLKKQPPWSGADSEITITANGDWSEKISGGLPSFSFPDILSIKKGSVRSSKEKPLKSPELLKPKLSAEKLKLLIDEFEKIQFFKFGKDFPLEDEKETISISDAGTEVISIRINGQTKEVFNYLGDFTKRRKLLLDLAEKIRGAGVWNFENDKIPQDLSITYRTDYGWGAFSESIIMADGRVQRRSASNMPPGKSFTSLLKGKTQSNRKTKPIKLNDKISENDLKQLIAEFEKIGFSAFKYSQLGSQNGCTNENLTSDGGESKYISVQINGKNMYASTYKGCQGKPESDAAKFEFMVTKLEELLKNVRAVQIK